MSELLDRYTRLGISLSPDSLPALRPSLRVNTLKISVFELRKRLLSRGVSLEPVAGFDDAFYFSASFSLSSTVEYLQGLLYIQGVASMYPARVLIDGSETSSTRILDMCAAPGSKTTQLSQLTRDAVPICACDNNGSRLKSLSFNLERCGIHNVATYRKDARFIDDLGISFDRILLDAPCSGNLCADKSFLDNRCVLDFKERSLLQRSLLEAAYESLSDDGVLVYSTCSLEPEENELVIDWFLREYPDMVLVDTGLELGSPGLTTVFDKQLDSSLSLTRRFWPPETATEGFYIAKLVRTQK